MEVEGTKKTQQHQSSGKDIFRTGDKQNIRKKKKRSQNCPK